jgi:DNA-binding MarR family transcriptional regulator
MTQKLTLDDFLPYRLSVASNAVSSRIAQSYRRRFGLKIPEWRIIAILAEHPQLTPQSLSESAQMDKITVSRAAAKMIERGLVTTNDNPGDGRSHFLSLTADGHSLYEEIAPLALALETELLGGFTAAEQVALKSLLERIQAATTGF